MQIQQGRDTGEAVADAKLGAKLCRLCLKIWTLSEGQWKAIETVSAGKCWDQGYVLNRLLWSL